MEKITSSTLVSTKTAGKAIALPTTAHTTDTLDHLLLQTVHEHPFTVSGGALIIGITVLKIIKKLRGQRGGK
jgi:hypothetical protein